MNPIDLGLIRQSYTDKFNQLYAFCKDNALKSKTLNGGKFLKIINHIKQDLLTIKSKGTKQQFDDYKTSLVPTLEAMEREIKYFQ